MYRELYQYFIQHRQLNVPGIGTFLLVRKPAVTDFPNKLIAPPSFSIALHHSSVQQPPKNFFSWLAHALQVSDRDAVIRFNDFAFDMKKRIHAGDKIQWEGVGTLSSGLAGEIRFESALKDTSFEAPVKAEKVIRENAEHTVRVGEDEKSSVEMIELLNQSSAKRDYWWALAIAIGVIAVMFIGWYFSEHGMKTSSSGNGVHAPVNETGISTYKNLP